MSGEDEAALVAVGALAPEVRARLAAMLGTRHPALAFGEDVRERIKDDNERMAGMAGNTLGELSSRLFAELDNLAAVDAHDSELLAAELDNLAAVDAHDSELLAAEVDRSRAVEGIASTIIENANTVLKATQMRASLAKGAVSVPKMLEG